MPRPPIGLALALITGLAATAAPRQSPAATTAYVVVGPEGRAIVRTIGAPGPCPVAETAAGPLPLTLRAGPDAPAAGRAAAFPDQVCEALAPQGVRRLRLNAVDLPLPKPVPKRLVVIGDTGCRIKAADHAAQSCNDPSAWPFRRIADSVARLKPDLVIHVGDYLYRETPCPAEVVGCQGSPFGDTADAWRADFFAPAAPLLRSAPLLAARGNHENCARAGRGWWRYLDPHPLAGGGCAAAEGQNPGDHGPPYRAPLGQGLQLLVLDSAAAGNKPPARGSVDRDAFTADRRALEALAGQARASILIDHHPLLAYAKPKEADGRTHLYGGNPTLLSVFGEAGPVLPLTVTAVISGHVHVFEQLSFKPPLPSQFVAGFSGTSEDLVPLPVEIPSTPPAPGAVVRALASWNDGFGFLSFDRTGPNAFKVTVRDVFGHALQRCRLSGKASRCGEGPSRLSDQADDAAPDARPSPGV